jgi:uncharacterized peroxidase-related enzyme
MNDKICWIDVVDYQEADVDLKNIYDGVRSPEGQLDNLYQAFSLRPHTIRPADDLYLATLHHQDNTLPKWFSELLGTYVAILTGCDYARAHHGQNFAYLMADHDRANNVVESLVSGDLAACGTEKEVSALSYANKLCLDPGQVCQSDIETLTRTGWSDGEILEIVQIVGMFSYFCRVINGVGISLGKEKIGLY